ncbi:MAG: hypothetical protein V1709_05520 [Planctomycetota bacterium]
MRRKYLITLLIFASGFSALVNCQGTMATQEIRKKIVEIRNGIGGVSNNVTLTTVSYVRGIYWRLDPRYNVSRDLEEYGDEAIPYIIELLLDEKASFLARHDAASLLVMRMNESSSIEAKSCRKRALIQAYRKYKGDLEIDIRMVILNAFYKITEGKEDIFYEAFDDPNFAVKALAGLILWERGEKNKNFVSKIFKAFETPLRNEQEMLSITNGRLKYDPNREGEGLYALQHLLRFEIGCLPESAENEPQKWWAENNRFFFLSKDGGYLNRGRFKLNETAKMLNLSVNETTGKMIDPKDGHELTDTEIYQLQHQYYLEQQKNEKNNR